MLEKNKLMYFCICLLLINMHTQSPIYLHPNYSLITYNNYYVFTDNYENYIEYINNFNNITDYYNYVESNFLKIQIVFKLSKESKGLRKGQYIGLRIKDSNLNLLNESYEIKSKYLRNNANWICKLSEFNNNHIDKNVQSIIYKTNNSENNIDNNINVFKYLDVTAESSKQINDIHNKHYKESENNVIYCKYNHSYQLKKDVYYLLEIQLLNHIYNIKEFKYIDFFTTTSNSFNKIIIDSYINFPSISLIKYPNNYALKENTTNIPLIIDEDSSNIISYYNFNESEKQNLIIETTNDMLVYIGDRFKIILKMLLNSDIKTKDNCYIIINFNNSDIFNNFIDTEYLLLSVEIISNSLLDINSSTTTTHEFNAIKIAKGKFKIQGLNYNLYKNSSLIISFFLESYNIGETSIEILVVYNNTSNIISQYKTNNKFIRINKIPIIPPLTRHNIDDNSLNFTGITHSENQDIFSGGSWPLRFTFTVERTLTKGGYIVITHIKTLKNLNMFNFIASTCDLSNLVNTDLNFKNYPPICRPLRADFNYINNDEGSSIYININYPLVKDKIYSLTVWASVENCGITREIEDSGNTSNNQNPDNNSWYFNLHEKLKFKYRIYSKIQLENKVNESIFNDLYMIGESKQLEMMNICYNSYYFLPNEKLIDMKNELSMYTSNTNSLNVNNNSNNSLRMLKNNNNNNNQNNTNHSIYNKRIIFKEFHDFDFGYANENSCNEIIDNNCFLKNVNKNSNNFPTSFLNERIAEVNSLSIEKDLTTINDSSSNKNKVNYLDKNDSYFLMKFGVVKQNAEDKLLDYIPLNVYSESVVNSEIATKYLPGRFKFSFTNNYFRKKKNIDNCRISWASDLNSIDNNTQYNLLNNSFDYNDLNSDKTDINYNYFYPNYILSKSNSKEDTNTLDSNISNNIPVYFSRNPDFYKNKNIKTEINSKINYDYKYSLSNFSSINIFSVYFDSNNYNVDNNTIIDINENKSNNKIYFFKDVLTDIKENSNLINNFYLYSDCITFNKDENYKNSKSIQTFNNNINKNIYTNIEVLIQFEIETENFIKVPLRIMRFIKLYPEKGALFNYNNYKYLQIDNIMKFHYTTRESSSSSAVCLIEIDYRIINNSSMSYNTIAIWLSNVNLLETDISDESNYPASPILTNTYIKGFSSGPLYSTDSEVNYLNKDYFTDNNNEIIKESRFYNYINILNSKKSNDYLTSKTNYQMFLSSLILISNKDFQYSNQSKLSVVSEYEENILIPVYCPIKDLNSSSNIFGIIGEINNINFINNKRNIILKDSSKILLNTSNKAILVNNYKANLNKNRSSYDDFINKGTLRWELYSDLTSNDNIQMPSNLLIYNGINNRKYSDIIKNKSIFCSGFILLLRDTSFLKIKNTANERSKVLINDMFTNPEFNYNDKTTNITKPSSMFISQKYFYVSGKKFKVALLNSANSIDENTLLFKEAYIKSSILNINSRNNDISVKNNIIENDLINPNSSTFYSNIFMNKDMFSNNSMFLDNIAFFCSSEIYENSLTNYISKKDYDYINISTNTKNEINEFSNLGYYILDFNSYVNNWNIAINRIYTVVSNINTEIINLKFTIDFKSNLPLIYSNLSIKIDDINDLHISNLKIKISSDSFIKDSICFISNSSVKSDSIKSLINSKDCVIILNNNTSINNLECPVDSSSNLVSISCYNLKANKNGNNIIDIYSISLNTLLYNNFENSVFFNNIYIKDNFKKKQQLIYNNIDWIKLFMSDIVSYPNTISFKVLSNLDYNNQYQTIKKNNNESNNIEENNNNIQLNENALHYYKLKMTKLNYYIKDNNNSVGTLDIAISFNKSYIAVSELFNLKISIESFDNFLNIFENYDLSCEVNYKINNEYVNDFKFLILEHCLVFNSIEDYIDDYKGLSKYTIVVNHKPLTIDLENTTYSIHNNQISDIIVTIRYVKFDLSNVLNVLNRNNNNAIILTSTSSFYSLDYKDTQSIKSEDILLYINDNNINIRNLVNNYNEFNNNNFNIFTDKTFLNNNENSYKFINLPAYELKDLCNIKVIKELVNSNIFDNYSFEYTFSINVLKNNLKDKLFDINKQFNYLLLEKNIDISDIQNNNIIQYLQVNEIKLFFPVDSLINLSINDISDTSFLKGINCKIKTQNNVYDVHCIIEYNSIVTIQFTDVNSNYEDKMFPIHNDFDIIIIGLPQISQNFNNSTENINNVDNIDNTNINSLSTSQINNDSIYDKFLCIFNFQSKLDKRSISNNNIYSKLLNYKSYSYEIFKSKGSFFSLLEYQNKLKLQSIKCTSQYDNISLISNFNLDCLYFSLINKPISIKIDKELIINNKKFVEYTKNNNNVINNNISNIFPNEYSDINLIYNINSLGTSYEFSYPIFLGLNNKIIFYLPDEYNLSTNYVNNSINNKSIEAYIYILYSDKSINEDIYYVKREILIENVYISYNKIVGHIKGEIILKNDFEYIVLYIKNIINPYFDAFKTGKKIEINNYNIINGYLNSFVYLSKFNLSLVNTTTNNHISSTNNVNNNLHSTDANNLNKLITTNNIDEEKLNIKYLIDKNVLNLSKGFLIAKSNNKFIIDIEFENKNKSIEFKYKLNTIYLKPGRYIKHKASIREKSETYYNLIDFYKSNLIEKEYFKHPFEFKNKLLYTTVYYKDINESDRYNIESTDSIKNSYKANINNFNMIPNKFKLYNNIGLNKLDVYFGTSCLTMKGQYLMMLENTNTEYFNSIAPLKIIVDENKYDLGIIKLYYSKEIYNDNITNNTFNFENINNKNSINNNNNDSLIINKGGSLSIFYVFSEPVYDEFYINWKLSSSNIDNYNKYVNIKETKISHSDVSSSSLIDFSDMYNSNIDYIDSFFYGFIYYKSLNNYINNNNLCYKLEVDRLKITVDSKIIPIGNDFNVNINMFTYSETEKETNNIIDKNSINISFVSTYNQLYLFCALICPLENKNIYDNNFKYNFMNSIALHNITDLEIEENALDNLYSSQNLDNINDNTNMFNIDMNNKQLSFSNARFKGAYIYNKNQQINIKFNNLLRGKRYQAKCLLKTDNLLINNSTKKLDNSINRYTVNTTFILPALVNNTKNNTSNTVLKDNELINSNNIEENLIKDEITTISNMTNSTSNNSSNKYLYENSTFIETSSIIDNNNCYALEFDRNITSKELMNLIELCQNYFIKDGFIELGCVRCFDYFKNTIDGFEFIYDEDFSVISDFYKFSNKSYIKDLNLDFYYPLIIDENNNINSNKYTNISNFYNRLLFDQNKFKVNSNKYIISKSSIYKHTNIIGNNIAYENNLIDYALDSNLLIKKSNISMLCIKPSIKCASDLTKNEKDYQTSIEEFENLYLYNFDNLNNALFEIYNYEIENMPMSFKAYPMRDIDRKEESNFETKIKIYDFKLLTYNDKLSSKHTNFVSFNVESNLPYYCYYAFTKSNLSDIPSIRNLTDCNFRNNTHINYIDYSISDIRNNKNISSEGIIFLDGDNNFISNNENYLLCGDLSIYIKDKKTINHEFSIDRMHSNSEFNLWIACMYDQPFGKLIDNYVFSAYTYNTFITYENSISSSNNTINNNKKDVNKYVDNTGLESHKKINLISTDLILFIIIVYIIQL